MHSKGELTKQQRSFMYLPLHVFRYSTNIHDLVAEKLREKNGKEPLKIAVNNSIRRYHEQMSLADKWDDIVLNRLEYTGCSKDKMNDARIWTLTKREQKRIFNAASDHQKQFLCLPLHVLKEQTNIRSLVGVSAHQKGYTLDDFVEYIYKILPKIDKWLPELHDLKFLNDADLDKSDAQQVDPPIDLSSTFSSTHSSDTKQNTRVLRKRKANNDEETSNEEPVPPKRLRTRSQTIEKKSRKNRDSLATEKSKTALTSANRAFKTSKNQQVIKPQTKNAFKIVSYTPTEFQRQVEEFSLADFVLKTNIKEVIQKEYRERVDNENVNISKSEMDKRLLHYYKYREVTRIWHEDGLKHLKLIDRENDSENGSQADKNELADIFSLEHPTNSQSSVRRQNSFDELTDFQKEVKEMDFATFVETTNIKDLVSKYLQEQFESGELTESKLNDGLKHFDRLRKHGHEWNEDPLKHLVFTTCKCKRYRQFEDKAIQTDSIQTKDHESQYQYVDFNLNDADMLDKKQDQQHKSSAITARMTSLTTHTICESEVICCQHIPDKSETNEHNSLDAKEILMTETLDNDFKPIYNSTISTEEGNSSNENDNLTLQNQIEMEDVLETNVLEDDSPMEYEEEMASTSLHVDGLINASEQNDDLQAKPAQSNLSGEVQPEINDRYELVEQASHLVSLNVDNPASAPAENDVPKQSDESTTVQSANSMIDFIPQQNSTGINLSVDDEDVTTIQTIHSDHSYHVRNTSAPVNPDLQTQENARPIRKSFTIDGTEKENAFASSQQLPKIQQQQVRRRSSTDNRSDVLRALSNAMRFTYYLENFLHPNKK